MQRENVNVHFRSKFCMFSTISLSQMHNVFLKFIALSRWNIYCLLHLKTFRFVDVIESETILEFRFMLLRVLFFNLQKKQPGRSLI